MSCHPIRGIANRPRTRPDQLTKTAWHEAGHALVCALYFGNIESLSIIPDEDSLGRLVFRLYSLVSPNRVRQLREAGLEASAENLARQGIQLCLAGRAAESILLGRASYWEGTPDFYDAIEYASALSATQSELLAGLLVMQEWRPVRRWLKSHRLHLQRITERLIAHRVLSAADLWNALAELPRLRLPQREQRLMRKALAEEQS